MLLNAAKHSEQRAALLGFAFGFLPLFSFVGAGVAAVWTLRRGVTQAYWSLAAILGPGVVLALMGDASALIGGILLLAFAQVLRTGANWSDVLRAATLMGLVATFAVEFLFRGLLPDILELAEQTVRGFAGELVADVPADALASMLRQLVIGSLTMASVVWALLALLLARYWQSKIWNPGGFAQEFLSLRLSIPFAGGLLAVVLMGGFLGEFGGRIVPILIVPLAITGLSVIHGVIAKRGMGKFAHAVPYVFAMVFISLFVPLLMVLAVADSIFNFRKLPNQTHEES